MHKFFERFPSIIRAYLDLGLVAGGPSAEGLGLVVGPLQVVLVETSLGESSVIHLLPEHFSWSLLVSIPDLSAPAFAAVRAHAFADDAVELVGQVVFLFEDFLARIIELTENRSSIVGEGGNNESKDEHNQSDDECATSEWKREVRLLELGGQQTQDAYQQSNKSKSNSDRLDHTNVDLWKIDWANFNCL